MKPIAVSVPFFFDVYEGFGQVAGILSTTKTGLSLQYEIRDALIGTIKTDLRKIFCSYADIADLDVKAGWFRTRIFIRLNTMESLKDIPMTHAGEMVLSVKRKHREAAVELVSRAKLSLSEYHLEMLENDAEADSTGESTLPC